MRQAYFEQERAQRWHEFEQQLAELDAGRPVSDFPRHYRILCHDLVLARSRRFDALLVARLNSLALRGHQHLHGARIGGDRWIDLFLHRFPAAVRGEWRLVLLLCLCFYGSGLAVFAFTQRDPEFIYSIASPEQIVRFEDMYDPAGVNQTQPRDVLENVSMFFFYIGNNVSIAFRTFAGGILFGVGSLLVIFFNGLVIGGLAGHIVNVGYTETFYPFVIAHGSFELTAIVLAGVAGMRMGLTLVRPGPLSRKALLAQATLRTVPILYGMTVMLIIAAAIEGLWSPARAIPLPAKYAVGAALWVLVIAWLALGGRKERRAAAGGLARATAPQREPV
jgi:uncharacterized membrane protein SpoIIM required for sporulation